MVYNYWSNYVQFSSVLVIFFKCSNFYIKFITLGVYSFYRMKLSSNSSTSSEFARVVLEKVVGSVVKLISADFLLSNLSLVSYTSSLTSSASLSFSSSMHTLKMIPIRLIMLPIPMIVSSV